jgi:hypothetical protein
VSDPPTSAFHVPGIISMKHCAWLVFELNICICFAWAGNKSRCLHDCLVPHFQKQKVVWGARWEHAPQLHATVILFSTVKSHLKIHLHLECDRILKRSQLIHIP